MSFLLKQLLKSKTRNLPKDEQDKIMQLMDKDPDLLMKLAKQAQEKINNGKDQMTAFMEVVNEHRDELQKLMINNQ